MMKTTVHCIKHQRDLHALSTLYPVYCTVLSFEAWLHHEIIIYNINCISMGTGPPGTLGALKRKV